MMAPKEKPESKKSTMAWLGKRIVIIIITLAITFVLGFIFGLGMPTWTYIIFTFFLMLTIIVVIEAILYIFRRRKR